MSDQIQQMTLETITPNIAKEWLARSSKNFRAASDKHIRRLADDMAEGLWAVNGETIKLNGDGSVKDGQHRLRAVIMAGTPIKSWVLRGLGDDRTIDTGQKRSVAQVLANKGYKNAAGLAAAANWIFRYERGKLSSGESTNLTVNQALDIIERHPGIEASVRVAERVRNVLRASIFSFVHYYGVQQNEERMEAFVEAVEFGARLAEDNPAFQLRRRMLQNKSIKGKLPPRDIMALTIKAWKLFRDEMAVEQLRWRSAGDKPEPFPEIEEEPA